MNQLIIIVITIIAGKKSKNKVEKKIEIQRLIYKALIGTVHRHSKEDLEEKLSKYIEIFRKTIIYIKNIFDFYFILFKVLKELKYGELFFLKLKKL